MKKVCELAICGSAGTTMLLSRLSVGFDRILELLRREAVNFVELLPSDAVVGSMTTHSQGSIASSTASSTSDSGSCTRSLCKVLLRH